MTQIILKYASIRGEQGFMINDVSDLFGLIEDLSKEIIRELFEKEFLKIISYKPLKYSISEKGVDILEKEIISWKEIRDETYFFCKFPRFFIPKYLIPFEIYPKDFMRVEQKQFLRSILEDNSVSNEILGIPYYIKGLTDNSTENLHSISSRKLKVKIYPNSTDDDEDSFTIKLRCHPFYWHQNIEINHPDMKDIIEDLKKVKLETVIENTIMKELDISENDLKLEIHWDQIIEKWILEIIDIKIEIIDLFFEKLSSIKYDLSSVIDKPEQQILLEYIDKYDKKWDLRINLNLKISKKMAKIVFLQFLSSKILKDLRDLKKYNSYINKIHQKFSRALNFSFPIPNSEEIKDYLWLNQKFEAAYITMYEEDFKDV